MDNPTLPPPTFASKVEGERRAKALAASLRNQRQALNLARYDATRTSSPPDKLAAFRAGVTALAALVASSIRLSLAAPGALPTRAFWDEVHAAARFCLDNGEGQRFQRLYYAASAAYQSRDVASKGGRPRHGFIATSLDSSAVPRLPEFESFIGLTPATA